ncbi:2Fe-2S iron-sulfur cluster-binding protein [Parvibaculum indicum]|uniref:2Fe-2S iron-sulfur cluster-binding protein n=1 Tax=Parvibaculum indicum TaxID=562969 RepID=UPI003CCD6A9E
MPPTLDRAGWSNGGCGICKIRVIEDAYEADVMSRQHVSEDDLREGQVLACRISPRSDLSVQVIGKMGKAWMIGPERSSISQTADGDNERSRAHVPKETSRKPVQ